MKADHKKDELSADERSSEDEVYFNEYLSADYIDLHLMGKGSEYAKAIDELCAGINKLDYRAKTCMNVLVANLYDAFQYAADRYVYLSMDENRYCAGSIYNRNSIGYTSLKKCMDHLLLHGFMEKTKPYFNHKFQDGYQTRIKATGKLIELLRGYGVKPGMIFVRDQEVLIVKDMPFKKPVAHKGMDGVTRKFTVKVTRPWDYRKAGRGDHKVTVSLRNKIERYNNLLQNSYIDIDPMGYVPKAKRKEPIFIDLLRKRVRRIFNRRKFSLGGRWYGGWWQAIPGDLRKHIIINGRPVVEIDYSGMHIHICYAMKGLKLRDLGLIPYIYTKKNDPENVRPYIKRIMLTAINCSKPSQCLRAVRRDIKSNPENYPEQPESKKLGNLLRKLRDQVLKYHSHISEYLNSGIGLKAQFIDSEIASEVIANFTAKKIPILCVHDSFICMNIHRDMLVEEMKKAYVKVVNREIIAKKKLELTINLEDVESDTDTLIEDLGEGISVSNLLEQAISLGSQSFPIKQSSEEANDVKSLKIANYIANNRHTIEFVKNPLFSKNRQILRQLEYLEHGTCNFNKKITI